MDHDLPDAARIKPSARSTVPLEPLTPSAPVYPPPIPIPPRDSLSMHPLSEASFTGYQIAVPLPPSHPRPIWPVAVGAFLLGGILFSAITCGLALLFLPVQRNVATLQSAPDPRPEATVVALRTPALRTMPAIATVTALAQDAAQVYGPRAGVLHLKGNNRVPDWAAGLSVQDFIAEAEFDNPYQSGTYGWDYGFFFRDTGFDHSYRLYVTSDGEWTLRFTDIADSPATPGAVPSIVLTATPLPRSAIYTIAGGVLTNLDTTAQGTNRLRLIARGGTGFFFVNDSYVATLDLRRKIMRGDVLVASAFRVSNNNPDHTVQFRNFSIWSLDQ
jgi:hypothetical protein